MNAIKLWVAAPVAIVTLLVGVPASLKGADDFADELARAIRDKEPEITELLIDRHGWKGADARAVFDADLEFVLDAVPTLSKDAERREYSARIGAQWILTTWADYRNEAKPGTPFKQSAFVATANKLAYVSVASTPDKADVTVGQVKFDPTMSDGFVRVDGKSKTRISVKKKGYDEIVEQRVLDPQKKNEFKFDLKESESSSKR